METTKAKTYRDTFNVEASNVSFDNFCNILGDFKGTWKDVKTLAYKGIQNSPIMVNSIEDTLKNNNTISVNLYDGDMYREKRFPRAYNTNLDVLSSTFPDNGGTALLRTVDGQLIPVGMSAVVGIRNRYGLRAKGFDILSGISSQALANVLNQISLGVGDTVKVLVENGKVRACNSSKYTPYTTEDLIDEVKWFVKDNPEAKIERIEADYERISVLINLEAYKDTIFKNFAGTFDEYIPKIRIITSHIAEYAVTIQILLCKNKMNMPIYVTGIKHIGNDVHLKVHENLSVIGNDGRFKIWISYLDKLSKFEMADISIKALRRIIFNSGLPKRIQDILIEKAPASGSSVLDFVYYAADVISSTKMTRETELNANMRFCRMLRTLEDQ